MMITERQVDKRQLRESQVQSILLENAGWKKRYSNLLESLESANPTVKDRAMATIVAMQNQQLYIERLARDRMLEATFSGSLGQLIPKLVDVVRIFYPNLITHDLVDVQPQDRMNGEVFIVRPVYSNSAAGVTAGQQMFANVTDGTYASEKTTAAVGSPGDGTETTFTGTLAPVPVRPGTLRVAAGAITGVDNGAGQIVGTGVTGSIDYTTGAISLTFTVAPANGVQASATFNYDSEQNTSQIRSVDIRMTTLPITAEPHPLRVSWSTQAQLAASAHLDLDIPDLLGNLVGSFIKQERDMLLTSQILASATADSNLNFDATPPTNYSRLAKYAEIEVKLNYAESQIQRTMGRGGISWIFGGTNACDVWRNAAGFVPSDVVAPIGPHVIGSLRDGTVKVIKVPSMDANTYVVGFKGYVVGDSAAILGEWIPLYATPVFQAPDLSNQQGLMSLYSLVMNQTGYFRKGVISGYAA